MKIDNSAVHRVTGGVDIYKELHIAAVVDEHDRVLASESDDTTGISAEDRLDAIFR